MWLIDSLSLCFPLLCPHSPHLSISPPLLLLPFSLSLSSLPLFLQSTFFLLPLVFPSVPSLPPPTPPPSRSLPPPLSSRRVTCTTSLLSAAITPCSGQWSQVGVAVGMVFTEGRTYTPLFLPPSLYILSLSPESLLKQVDSLGGVGQKEKQYGPLTERLMAVSAQRVILRVDPSTELQYFIN